MIDWLIDWLNIARRVRGNGIQRRSVRGTRDDSRWALRHIGGCIASDFSPTGVLVSPVLFGCSSAWLVHAYVSACRFRRFTLPIHHSDSLPASLTAAHQAPRLLFPYAVRESVRPSVDRTVAPPYSPHGSMLVVISLNCTRLRRSSVTLTAWRAVCLVRSIFRQMACWLVVGRCAAIEHGGFCSKPYSNAQLLLRYQSPVVSVESETPPPLRFVPFHF